MTLQNRVLPTGEIVADPARGAFMGNRGILHTDSKTLGASRWKHPHWIICRLDFKNRQREIMAPRRYTELFFYDEAVALAAGHRPCAECRRDEYNHWRDCWLIAFGDWPSANDMDRILHRTRVAPRTRQQITHAADAASVPDGVFIRAGQQTGLIHNQALVPFSTAGYGPPQTIPDRQVKVLTPAPTVAVLKAGYQPDIRI